MTLKETIEKDFVTAFKAKNAAAKSALSMLKAKITEAEKAVSNTVLNEAETLKVVLASVKQRKQSIEEFIKAGRTDLVEKEQEELKHIEAYLPKQLSREEIKTKVEEILTTIPAGNRNMVVGKAMGAMNKAFTGQFDPKILTEILNELVAA